jgi:hypothetical protein
MVVEVPVVAAGADDGIRVIALGLAGRHDEAREALARMQRVALMSTFRIWTDALLAWLDRRVPEMKAGMAALGPLKIAQDPEAIFQEGLVLCDVGDDDEGVERLHRAVAKGYFPVATLEDRPQFDRVRATPAFQAVLREAQVGRDRALASFRDAGGERLLGR